jgi:2-methylisocitrate lyase-like PEP mutase family enzyme
LGADVLFVESPESESELAQIVAALPDAKLLANMVDGGRTPFLSPAALEAMGFAIAIYPVQGLAAAAAGLQSAYQDLLGEQLEQTERMSFPDLNKAVGFEAIWAGDAETNSP